MYKASVQKCLYSDCSVTIMLTKKSKTLEADQVAFETPIGLHHVSEKIERVCHQLGINTVFKGTLQNRH